MKLADEDFDEGMIEALEEVKESLLNGKPLHHIATFRRRAVDVPALRARHGMTQQAFADAIGISVGTLRNWEQGRRMPEGPARRLLEIIEDHPETLAERIAPESDDIVGEVDELLRLGNEESAERLVLRAWRQRPRPELARAFASIRPDETLQDRSVRFERLLSIDPGHPESLLLKAELALAAEDWQVAYAAVSAVREHVPSPRTWAIVAAISRGSGAPDSFVRAWLERALAAPAGGEARSAQGGASVTPLLVLPEAKDAGADHAEGEVPKSKGGGAAR